MKFEDFVDGKYVRKMSSDNLLIKSLIITADSDLLFLKKTSIDKNSARKAMSNYYDVLRSILEAIACKHGYKIYSNEIFTYFLRYLNESIIAEKFDRFRKIRNNINYYGKDVSVEEVKEHSLEIIKIIETLKKKYLSF